jgi:hypothetical protein
VIPKEGVESFRRAKIVLLDHTEIVIPKEGVERAGALKAIELQGLGDPERGS